MMFEAWVAGGATALVLGTGWATIRRFWNPGARLKSGIPAAPKPLKPSPTGEPSEDECARVMTEHAENKVDANGNPLCAIEGCMEVATEPRLAIDTWTRDKLFGADDRLHGRIARFKVVTLLDGQGNPQKGRHCMNHSRQIEERMLAVINEGRSRASQCATQIFDYFTEMNLGGVEKAIALEEAARQQPRKKAGETTVVTLPKMERP